MRQFNFAALLCLLSVAVLIGCSGATSDPSRPKTVPVSGTITYSGSPVADATVAFTTDVPDRRGGVGRTDQSGKYTLTTFAAGDGAIPGSYKVTVSKVQLEGQLSEEEAQKYQERGEPIPVPTEKNLVPEKYKSADTTDLTAEVKDGGANTLDFQLAD